MHESLENRRLGDFELIRELGRGGMGIVYEARQVSLNRRVALKVLSSGLDLSQRTVERFHREAEAAAKLHHTNIVPVYATGQDHGTHFYAMELIDGPSLDRVVRQLNHDTDTSGAPLKQPADDATAPYLQNPAESIGKSGLSSTTLGSSVEHFDVCARLIAEVADALDYAHNQGVIHRDLKPANLLLSPVGHLSINDFGLARMLEQAGMTMTGEFVGTPAYMSPEQITAGRTPLDHRTDIYSLGATLYELLTLRRPFSGDGRDQVLAQILHKEPVRPRSINGKIPVDLETICLKAMAKDPDHRYLTAQAMADDLRRYLNRFAISAKRAGLLERVGKFVRRNRLVTAGAALIVVLALVAGLANWLYLRARDDTSREEQTAEQERQKNWAHEQIPVITAKIASQQYGDAFNLLTKVERLLPADARLNELRNECSWVLTILTDPPGATVSRHLSDTDSWEVLGETPLNDRRLARGNYHWKFEKPEFVSVEGLGWDRFLDTEDSRDGGAFAVKLLSRSEQPPDMVAVQDRAKKARILFFVDRYEVTNRQFKKFVDRGGYGQKDLWEHAFETGERSLSWEDAMKRFRDTTGRSGPANWIGGTCPEGQDEFPVSGVSWYEAAAYAKFVGKQLPPVDHWRLAAGLDFAALIVANSNFEATGPVKVGQFRSLGPFGTFDMAGNVKEWCFNRADAGKRWVLGGAWDEQRYVFVHDDRRSAWNRERTIGFRCAKYLPGQEPGGTTVADFRPPYRDFLAVKPLTDREFELVKARFAYNKSPLNAKVVREEETTQWTHERVEIDAAYNKERLTIHLFLPKEAGKPFQPVIHWPGSGATRAGTIASPFGEGLAFLIQSGRALVWPIYKGTYERRLDQGQGTPFDWENKILQVHDLQRTLDYLQSRKDLDSSAIGYYGISWGASEPAAYALGVENRVKAAVLVDGGLWIGHAPPPEQDAVHFWPRVKIPTLMLNGEYDTIFPPEESQNPMFQLLGSDGGRKEHRLFRSSHVSIPLPERIRETVGWFDRYLGPVNRKSDPGRSLGLTP